ncbi:IFT46 [Bugula neritina]|uniref:Intraflagellar transport protein 46 homolog n=1 Tax=Bugula neritina TaxID=10212 RepID=A0A7J7JTH4_BUGNE|nr:IFT46 [Bugula neritina]
MASGRASVVGDGRRVPDEPPSYEDLFGPAKASPDKNVHATPSAPPLEEINLSKEDLSDEAAEPHCDNPPQLDSRPPSANLEALFQYIRSYKPESIKLKRKLKPFILDYIPAVTAPDLMIKVSRPDGRPEQLGFRVLDEPGSQSFDLENMKIDDENGKKKGGGGDMPKPTHAPSAGPHSAHQFDEDDDENGEQIEGTLFNNS